MSLLLCSQERAAHPLWVEELGVRIYSSQELAYVIYHHPLLVMDGFVGAGLLDFLRDELKLGFLALKIQKCLSAGENPDEALILILQECDYCTPAEISRYKQILAGIRKKDPEEYKKLKADELFSLRQYGKAASLYRDLAAGGKDGAFRAKIWNNLASCYARMFQMEKAMDAYIRAYAADGEPEILQRIYCLTRLDGRLKLGDRQRAMISADMQKKWDEEMEAARKRAARSEQVSQVDQLFSETDGQKRQAGEARLIGRWKQEYRSMV